MNKLKKLIYITIIIVGCYLLWSFDKKDRIGDEEHFVTEKEKKYFTAKANPQSIYENNFGNENYKFPREKVSSVKVYKNVPIIGRLTSVKLDDKDLNKIVDLFNNPDNFHWDETTWGISDSEYIFRFFNKEDKEVGKVWMSLEGTYMTKSIPFCPSQKFGGLSGKGSEEIVGFLKELNF